MSETFVERRGGSPAGASTLIERARHAEGRARRSLASAIDDLFLPEDARLDDRTRTALANLLEGLVATVEDEIREYGARVLRARGDVALATSLAEGAGPPLIDRLIRAGLLRDPEFISECLARVRLELTGEALPAQAPETPETPSLIVRLARSSDRIVASAAAAVLTGESARRAANENGRLAGTGLPAELHHRLVWWVAAAVRARAPGKLPNEVAALDRALAEAAARNLAAHDEGDRLEAAAMRLAAALDAGAEDLPILIVESIRDRRLPMFIALLAHALGVSYELVRELALEPTGDRMWLLLRALEVPRDAIAAIGYALSEADPRRDVESFAEMLDTIVSVEPDAARLAVAPLRLHPNYRAALRALAPVERRR